jgi:hypothetical protein
MADGTLKVGTITNSAGSGNIAIGSGVTLLSNTPAFYATMSANQTISTGTATKLVYDTETFDTDNCYDSTNYRFTPTEAGKYQVGMQVRIDGDALQSVLLYFYKNGSQNKRIQFYCANTGANQSVGIFTTIVELNGSTDYLEAYVNLAATTTVFGNNDDNYFTAYRIGA